MRDHPAAVLVAMMVSGLVAGAATGAWCAFVFYKMYEWFVFPLGAPALNFWHIWGLLTTFNLLVIYTKPSRSDNDQTWNRAVAQVLAFAFLLLIGWLIHTMV